MQRICWPSHDANRIKGVPVLCRDMGFFNGHGCARDPRHSITLASLPTPYNSTDRFDGGGDTLVRDLGYDNRCERVFSLYLRIQESSWFRTNHGVSDALLSSMGYCVLSLQTVQTWRQENRILVEK